MLAGKEEKKKGLASQICKRRQCSSICITMSSLKSVGYSDKIHTPRDDAAQPPTSWDSTLIQQDGDGCLLAQSIFKQQYLQQETQRGGEQPGPETLGVWDPWTRQYWSPMLRAAALFQTGMHPNLALHRAPGPLEMSISHYTLYNR